MKIGTEEVDLEEIIKKQIEANNSGLDINRYIGNLKMSLDEWSAFTNQSKDLWYLDGLSEEEKKVIFDDKKMSYDFFCKVIPEGAIASISGKTLLNDTIAKKMYYENLKKNFPNEYASKKSNEPSEEDILNLKEIANQWNDIKVRMQPYKELEKLNFNTIQTAIHPSVSAIEDGTQIELVNTKLQNLLHSINLFKEIILTDDKFEHFEEKVQETVKSAVEKYKDLFEKTGSEIIEKYNLSETIKKEYLKNELNKEKWGKSYDNEKLLEDSFEIDDNGNIKILNEDGAKKLIIEGGNNRRYCTERIFANEVDVMVKEVPAFFKEYRSEFRSIPKTNNSENKLENYEENNAYDIQKNYEDYDEYDDRQEKYEDYDKYDDRQEEYEDYDEYDDRQEEYEDYDEYDDRQEEYEVYNEVYKGDEEEQNISFENLSDEELEKIIKDNEETISANDKIIHDKLVEKILNQQRKIAEQENEIARLKSEKSKEL